MRSSLSWGLIVLVSIAAHAGPPDGGISVTAKEEIRRLAVERIRSAGSDYERVIVAAENRTRALYDNRNDAGNTPSPRLDEDLRDLRSACQKMQRLVTASHPPDSDPIARQIIDEKWTLYREKIDTLSRQILEKKRERAPESRIYWETLHAFKDLKEQTATDLLFNTPQGESGLEEAMSRDESTLLLACETTAKKTRGKNVRVVAPHEFAGTAKPDIQAFYRSLDLVPDARPLRTGSFTIPPGSRTVTMREDKSRMVFRPKKGQGIAYVGQTETEFNYDYLAVPPDTACYFENTGSEPLELEFVGIKP